MRIAFDGTTLTPRRTGVGYYTEHLLQHLAREVETTGDELIVISNRRIDVARPLPRHVQIYQRAHCPLRIGWMQLLAGRILEDLRADVAHFTTGMVPLGTAAARVVTIHDMSLRLFPACHPARRLVINRPLQSLAIRVADAVVAVSHSARRDLMRLHRLPADRVTVVHEAAGPGFEPIDDTRRRAEVRRRYHLPGRFFLFVGAIEPRKNLHRLIDAFAIARRHGIRHQLLCVGPYGWSSRDVYAHVDRLGLRDVVRFTGYVPVNDLPVIYNLASVFVFPSLYEGFGLPVVEAMACGTPVVTSNSSSLAEIADGAALTVDPLDTEAIAGAITDLARDEARCDELRQLGLVRSRKFSWRQTARDMLAVYGRALGMGVPQPRAVETFDPIDPTVPVKHAVR
jgi:glycosyltransferase involved in cell wall biosynthesis